jgi:enoyl-CoA hydratase
MWSCLETPSLEAAIDLEARTQILGTMTQDFVEQMQSSREKRPPQYGNQ